MPSNTSDEKTNAEEPTSGSSSSLARRTCPGMCRAAYGLANGASARAVECGQHVKIKIGDDPGSVIGIQQHGTTAGAQHPSDVIDRFLRIAEMLQHTLAPDKIDARVGDRQGPGESIDERNV